MAPDDPADSDLRERVAELEQTVEKQQATIEQLLPSRRRVLQAGGLVAGGGVLGALTADRASAQASGQVGTSSDPVDVEAFDLNVQDGATFNGSDISNVGSVNTDKVGNGGSPITFTDDLDINQKLVKDLAESAVEKPAIDFESKTLNDGDKDILIPGQPRQPAAVFVSVRGPGSWALVFLRGNNNSVDIGIDPQSAFSTTEDNDGTINIYYDSGNGRYEINNEDGGGRNILLWFLVGI